MDILNNVLNIILTAFMGYVIWLLQNYKKRKDDIRDALVILLRETIEWRYTVYVSKETLTREEYHDFEGLWTVYSRLGGNGTGERMWNEIKNKPIRG